MSEVPSFSDVIPRRERLPGRKVSIYQIFDREIVVTAWTTGPSRYFSDDGRRLTRLTVQFDLNGEQCVILTNSDVLRHQLVEYEERGGQLPFRTTIRRDGCFKFT